MVATSHAAAALFGVAALSSQRASAVPAADLVEALPDFEATHLFETYSGMLHVPMPASSGYASLDIHYQFHTSQDTPSDDPVVTWHQGGPGGSAIYGLYGEMGFFQLSDEGTSTNEYAWNRVANMLYLESPAGSTVGFSDSLGFSTCTELGATTPAHTCAWNDTSQAVAYAMTLEAFFLAFPEFATNDLYLTGESYAGQYLPNIADYITTEFWPQKRLSNLKGIAVGNGCWGGDETSVVCNGPNEEQNDIDLFYGKGLISKKLRDGIYAACKYGEQQQLSSAEGLKCAAMVAKADAAMGPSNVYNLYDNCPLTDDFLQRTGKTMTWLRAYLRNSMNTHGADLSAAHAELKALNGGFEWTCGAMPAVAAYFERADVQKAMHLPKPNLSGFRYDTSGPASVLLYPKLVNKIRVLIYNGDADSCVPYKGNEEWTTALADTGAIVEKDAWHPWFVSDGGSTAAAGYATNYAVANSTLDFAFVTIRLSGHMVPNFTPEAAFVFFKRFLKGEAM